MVIHQMAPLLFLGSWVTLFAQPRPQPQVSLNAGAADPLPQAQISRASETAVIGPIADGKPSPPVAEVEKPKFQIRNTITQKIMREEAAQAEGMEPVRKQVTATVHVVNDPKLIDPAPPLPALEITDPAVIARMNEMRANAKNHEIVFVSATVYDHEHTLLRWWPNGQLGK
jgi:hypothetical protein